MAKVIVIGGGLAGISASVFLSKNNHKVTLIESSPKLGGRTYSFYDKKNKTEIDNGQHLLMGSYKNTFELLSIIGSNKILKYQKNLLVQFFDEKQNKFALSAEKFFYPFNLINAIWNFNALTKRQRISVSKLFLKLLFTYNKKLRNINVYEWLKSLNQSEEVIEKLWKSICESALNTDINEASADLFYSVLKKMFLCGNNNSTFVLPNSHLNKIFVNPAIEFLKSQEIEIFTSEKLRSIQVEDNKVISILTENQKIDSFDYLILAIPHHSIKFIESNVEIISEKLLNMETSPIITIHLWLKENLDFQDFIGFINSPIHWIFDNKTHYSIVISAAEEISKLENNEILDLVKIELTKYLPNFSENTIISYRILKEKRATLKCSIENEILRKSVKSKIANLVLAGDWINTSLPSTIEGAILSGKNAAEIIFNKNN